jgi:hypothetical protein
MVDLACAQNKLEGKRHRTKGSPVSRSAAAAGAELGAGHRVALFLLEAKASRKTATTTKEEAVQLEPIAALPDVLREFMRARAREYQRGTGAPMYNFPFIGCKVLNVLTTGSASWNGLLYSIMAACTQGVADNQRTGDVIRIIGIDARIRCSKGGAVAPGSDSEYQLKISYTPLGQMPINTIYQDVGTAYSGTSPADWDYRSAIKDYFHVFDYVDTYHPMRLHHVQIRCNELTNFDQGTSTITTGYWTLSMISGEDPAAPTQVPAMYSSIQVYYQDV